MQLRLKDIALSLNISFESGADRLVSSVESDTRKIVPGALFVCIKGERVDGHDFAVDAVRQGAVAVLAERPLPDVGVPVLVVADSVRALGQIATMWRRRTRAKVVGITGTAGKTTVKEVLAQVLECRGVTARNPLNLNNQIGMPLSLLRATGEESFWVFEAGISHAHDMDELASILCPDVALVLNVGAGHTEGLGDKGVAWHKARLLRHVAQHGCALVCSDYPELVRESLNNYPEVKFFSAQDADAAFYAQYMGGNTYKVKANAHSFEVKTPFYGAYGAENVAAVAAVATELGLTAKEIQAGLAAAQLPQQRFACISVGKWQLIDDTYNANPLSMSRMIAAARDLAGQGNLCVMLGEMRELGACAAEEHRKIGKVLAQVAPRMIFWKGEEFDAVRQGLQEGGYSGVLSPVADPATFITRLSPLLAEGGVCLCKGSRSNHLEEMVAAFLAEMEKKDAL